ncbi:unnamed protein product [Durusdinium trenchii]|uniref:Aprataxin (Forkhead-associated domain histidine triad-like protein) (FHA-HIT) n=2 Tax=Durusdinium trenchii TaxID=1381693 RepID=A0ABP0PLB2_9DINO
MQHKLIPLLVLFIAGHLCRTFSAAFRQELGKMADTVYQSLKGEVPQALAPNPGPVKRSGHFSTILEQVLDGLDAGDTSLQPHVVHITEEFVTIHDGYPKAAVHLLVLPRRVRIAALEKLTHEHLPLLMRLSAYVAWLMEQVEGKPGDPGVGWTHGLHSVPSLRQLHVHVLSMDFESPCMKKAKHFSSFLPPFLVSLDTVVARMQEGGFSHRSLQELEDAMNKRRLCCHRCGVDFGRGFAELKRHLSSCSATPKTFWPMPRLWRDQRGCKRSIESESCDDGAVIDLT